MNQWLADQENQEELYALCRQIIIDAAPEEEPILEELFPRYIELARTGEVVAGADASEAFGFSGDSDLMTLIVVPILLQIMAFLLAKYSLTRIKELKGRGQEDAPHSVIEEEVQQEAEKILRQQGHSQAAHKEMTRTIARFIAGRLEND